MATKLGIVLADFTTALATELGVAGTTVTLQSNVDDDGVTLPDGLIYLTLDGANSSKEHIQAVKTGANLASIYSVSRQGTLSSGAVRKHRIGATVTLTDFATIKYLTDLVKGTTDLDASDPLKYDDVASLTPGSNQLATVAYADNLAYITGSPNMSLTVKGIAEEATAAEIDAGTQTGGTSAELTVNPKYLKDSIYYTQLPTADQKAALAGTGTPNGTTGKYVTNDDTATAATANKVARRLAGGNITVVTESAGNNSTNAASTAYTDNIAPKFGTGQTSRLVAAGTGTQNIAHGLGRTPTSITINYITSPGSGTGVKSIGTGTSSGTGGTCTYMRQDPNGAWVSNPQINNAIIRGDASDGSAIVIATVSAVDSTNITLNFTTMTGTGTGAYFQWTAHA